MKKRLIYGISAFIILIIEILIALFVNDEFIRPYGGDILVVILLGCITRIAFPNGIKLLPVWIFIFAVMVEIAQGINIVSVLGLNDITFFRILIGTSFSFIDILCYGAGCILFWLAEKPIHKENGSI